MKKREEKFKVNPVKKKILIALISLIIVLQAYSLAKCAVDNYNEEKTSLDITSIDSTTPSVVVIEIAETITPETEIYGELIYEEESTPLIVAQGLNFNDFYEFNKDTVGVLAIPGTNIYYPICGSDNDEEYLETLFNGKGSAYGTIFLDYVANKDINGKVTTLFGHNMKDGKMFAPLNKYLAYSDYNGKHQYAFISTKDYIYIYKFATVARVTSEEAVALRQNSFKNEEEYKKYLEILKERTKYKDESVSLENSEKLLQLMTCVGNHNYRTSVVFSYETRIPNIFNTTQTTEEIQKSISDLTSRKSSFVSLAKKEISYNLASGANYVMIQGINDGVYIWTKDALTEKERTAFIEMYNLDSYSNYVFINGHNSFDIDGKRVAIESINGETKVFAETVIEKTKDGKEEQINSIKSVKSGKFTIRIGKEKGQERVYKIN